MYIVGFLSIQYSSAVHLASYSIPAQPQLGQHTSELQSPSGSFLAEGRNERHPYILLHHAVLCCTVPYTYTLADSRILHNLGYYRT